MQSVELPQVKHNNFRIIQKDFWGELHTGNSSAVMEVDLESDPAHASTPPGGSRLICEHQPVHQRRDHEEVQSWSLMGSIGLSYDTPPHRLAVLVQLLLMNPHCCLLVTTSLFTPVSDAVSITL